MSWDISSYESWKYDEIPLGCVAPEPGTSRLVQTGGWRTDRPVWDASVCKNCLICWVYCPDASIEVKDGQMTGIDYEHCKGCGVCARECKFGAISMVNEQDAKQSEVQA